MTRWRGRLVCMIWGHQPTPQVKPGGYTNWMRYQCGRCGLDLDPIDRK